MDNIQCGDIVTFGKGHKPGTPSEALLHNLNEDFEREWLAYEAWDGFSHGVVAHTENGGKTVFLYLFDSAHETLYLDGTGLPVRVQFSDDELLLLRKAGDFGSGMIHVKSGDADAMRKIQHVLHPELPHVPHNILNGTATLREFQVWAESVDLRNDVMMGELNQVMQWVLPFVAKVFGEGNEKTGK